VHDQFTDHTNAEGVGIGVVGSGTVIHHNTIDGAYIGIDQYQNAKDITDVEIHSNDISHTNWGIDVPSWQDWSYSHYAIHDNHIHDTQNWDTDNDAFHRDGIFLRHDPDGGGSGYVTDVFIYNNLFDGAFSDCCGTSWLYYNSNQKRIYVFNNLFVSGGDGLTVQNNIFLDLNNWSFYFGDLTRATFDYNAYDNSNTSNAPTEPHWVVAADLGLAASYAPQAGSPVIGSGLNLTALGIPLLNVDRAGRPRPASGAWDIGPYQYDEPDSAPPAAPANLQVR
jgi:hypothetical protein